MRDRPINSPWPEEHAPVQVFDKVSKTPPRSQVHVAAMQRGLVADDHCLACELHRHSIFAADLQQVWEARFRYQQLR